MVTTVLFQEELQPGLPVDKYILYERIGIGGEGLIFSAWDTVEEHVVAIKFFSKRNEQGAPSNLSSELAAFSRLEHQNIREIMAVGETNDFLYSVMRYFPLGSLSERIFTQTLTIDDTLFISVQLSSALDFLQKNGIVHRDLKPTNILLNIENRAYLTDFGLAKPISNTTQVLHTGHGTPIYAAPEQHTLSKITAKSDIYSFGIMLYEMFTGALPWGGTVSLAIMQLDNREQLPDPRDANPALPPNLAHSLRKITSMNPDFRPATAREAVLMIINDFKEAGYPLPEVLKNPPRFSPEPIINRKEAFHLINLKQANWDPASEKIKVSYSHFAFLHSVLSKKDFNQVLDTDILRLMLHGALTFGVDIDFWWNRLEQNQEKIKICQHVIANEGEHAVKRTISRLLDFVSANELQQMDTSQIIPRLITLAYESPSISLKAAIFQILMATTQPAARWHKVSVNEAAELTLANLVLFDPSISVEAARYIGWLKSERAVEILLEGIENQPDTDYQALIEVWETAGSLPRDFDRTIKLQLGIELGWKQLLRDRRKLVNGYLSAALACALGIGLHVFISMRVPTIVNVTRILNMLGNGLLFGPLIGLGVFLARFIPLRLKVLSKAVRAAAGTIVGGFLISLAFMLFHIMFLNAYPTGPLVTLGSLVMALGFALTNYAPIPVWLRMAGSTVGTAAAIVLTWLGYLKTFATPLLFYTQDQPLQTALLITLFSLSVGIITYIFSLKENAEGRNHE